MIGVKLSGRVGNNLFQIAAAISLSRALNTSWFIINSKDKKEIKIPWNNLINKQLFNIRGKGKIELWGESEFLEHHNESQPLDKKFIYLKGYFQSEIFFINDKELIKKKFTSQYLNPITEYKRINNIIHIRGGDYLRFEGYSLSKKYYESAMQCDGESIPWHVVTDDIGYAKRLLEGLPIEGYYSQSLWKDIKSIAKANRIIVSNSTFAWWGAYLNQNDATVIAPKYWLGGLNKQENPKNIIPSHWISLDAV